MMTHEAQLDYFRTLGLDPYDVTDLRERDAARNDLMRAGQWSPQVADKFNNTPLDITDLAKIKKAWRKLAKAYHPDHYSQEAYDEYVKNINEPTDVDLSSSKEVVLSEAARVEKFKEIMHAYNMLTDPSYCHKFRTEGGCSQASLDATFNLTIDFYQAFMGDSVSITINPVHVDDSGAPVKIDKEKDVYMECEVILVRIKEGTQTGDQVTVTGKGLCRGEERGNLKLTMQVVPHHKYRMEPPDLIDFDEIPLDMMLTGGEMDIATMWGIEKLRVPAGTNPQDKLYIKRKGVGKVGDHVVEIRPLYPDKKELKRNSAWKRLGINWNTEQERDDKEREEEQGFQDVFQTLQGSVRLRTQFTSTPQGGAFF